MQGIFVCLLGVKVGSHNILFQLRTSFSSSSLLQAIYTYMFFDLLDTNVKSDWNSVLSIFIHLFFLLRYKHKCMINCLLWAWVEFSINAWFIYIIGVISFCPVFNSFILIFIHQPLSLLCVMYLWIGVSVEWAHECNLVTIKSFYSSDMNIN